MKKLTSTTKLTIGAMTTALGVLFMYAASVFPTGRIALIFLASLVIWIPINERGGLPVALVCYLATAVLTLILIPNKLYPLGYALFIGLYGFVKLGVDNFVRDRIMAFALKLIIMNLLGAAIIWLGGLILKQSVFSLMPDYKLAVVVIVIEAVFIVYEIVYSLCVRVFDERLRDVIIPKR
ncbi:MAG: hypothetical protein IKS90_04610 [Clostridia bacterium]|nr:hypothetical protein [Clostridia bacterium]